MTTSSTNDRLFEPTDDDRTRNVRRRLEKEASDAADRVEKAKKVLQQRLDAMEEAHTTLADFIALSTPHMSMDPTIPAAIHGTIDRALLEGDVTPGQEPTGLLAAIDTLANDQLEEDAADDAFKVPGNVCAACEGSGTSSGGRQCRPCDGTGKRRETVESLTEDSNPFAAAGISRDVKALDAERIATALAPNLHPGVQPGTKAVMHWAGDVVYTVEYLGDVKGTRRIHVTAHKKRPILAAGEDARVLSESYAKATGLRSGGLIHQGNETELIFHGNVSHVEPISRFVSEACSSHEHQATYTGIETDGVALELAWSEGTMRLVVTGGTPEMAEADAVRIGHELGCRFDIMQIDNKVDLEDEKAPGVPVYRFKAPLEELAAETADQEDSPAACPDCKGDGRIPDKTGGGHHGTCKTCSGTGKAGE